MTVEADAVRVPASPVVPPGDGFEILPFGEEAPLSPHRQINERRAQIENPELLKRLRGL